MYMLQVARSGVKCQTIKCNPLIVHNLDIKGNQLNQLYREEVLDKQKIIVQLKERMQGKPEFADKLMRLNESVYQVVIMNVKEHGTPTCPKNINLKGLRDSNLSKLEEFAHIETVKKIKLKGQDEYKLSGSLNRLFISSFIPKALVFENENFSPLLLMDVNQDFLQYDI